jgi:hypothetical protein
LKLACSLCGCRTSRADCPRCGERQLTFFEKPPPVPDDAETVTLDEIAEAARRERETATFRDTESGDEVPVLRASPPELDPRSLEQETEQMMRFFMAYVRNGRLVVRERAR